MGIIYETKYLLSLANLHSLAFIVVADVVIVYVNVEVAGFVYAFAAVDVVAAAAADIIFVVVESFTLNIKNMAIIYFTIHHLSYVTLHW